MSGASCYTAEGNLPAPTRTTDARNELRPWLAHEVWNGSPMLIHFGGRQNCCPKTLLQTPYIPQPKRCSRDDLLHDSEPCEGTAPRLRVHKRGRSPEAHGGRRARGAEDARRGRSTSPRRPRPTCSLRGQHDQAGPATVLRAVRECVATSLVSEMSSFRVRGCDPVSYTHLDVYKRQV